MNKQQKDNLFKEYINEIENEFLQAVPEIRNRLGEMTKPEDNGFAMFEIPMDHIIPQVNLTVACEGKWDTGRIKITHYKMEAKDETQEVS
jgi:hypothetical protein